MEGDTPAFFHIIPTGLSNPEYPNWGSWGGRYELYTPAKLNHHYQQETRPLWADTADEVIGLDGQSYTTNHATIWRWREGYQYDFAARIDWSNTPKYDDANHRPVAAIDGNKTLAIGYIEAKQEETITLSAAASTDPDGDDITYRWFQYREAGTLPYEADIEGHDSAEVEITLPGLPDADGPWVSEGTIHIILELHDNGAPNMYAYRRIIVDVGQ